MPTVLLTRPQASSALLAVELKRRGYDTVIEPLLTVISTHAPPPDENFDAVIITSANALMVLEKTGVTRWFNLPCFCAGTHTANTARAFGFHDVHDAEGDGAALASLLRQQPTGHSILHIAGNDISPSAQAELQSLNRSITPWVVYKAAASKKLSPSTIDAIKQQKLDAALLFSPRSAEILHGLLAQHALEACCASLIAIGISEAALTALRPLSWRKLEAAAKPTEEAVIQRLQTLLPVTRA